MTKSSSPKNSMAHIALLISIYFTPEPGGGARTAWNRALILHKIGYTVFVICGFPSYPTGRVYETRYRGKFFYVEKMDNFTLIRLRLLPLESRGYLRRFILYMNFIFLCFIWMPRILTISLKPELVYALAPILFSCIIGLVYAKVTKSFFIYEVSAFWPEELVALRIRLYSIISLFGKTFAKLSYILPDMLVVISNSAAKYIANNYHPKVLIYAMPIGVDPDRYPSRTKESSRKELIQKNILPAVLENKFIVLYAGVISKVTKVINLIYAADKLKDNQNNIAFLIIGEGEEKESIEQFKSDNMINNLYLLPFQDAKFVPYIISAADVCVVPLSPESIYETTLPTKFFDYLACNKPQIGICGGELEELINTNKIGLTVKDGEIDKLVNVVLSLSNSPSLIDSMILNSRELLSNFTLGRLSFNFDKVLGKEILIKNTRIKK
jgi:glycosyltransferase involved in cell wall biosynthesis